MEECGKPGHGPVGPPYFALKLSAAARKKARQDPEVIPSILNRAISGAGDGIRVEFLLPSELSETIATLISRAICMDPDYNPPDFDAWYRVKVATGSAGHPTLCGQPEPDLIDRLIERLNGPDFPEVESAHTLRIVPPPAGDGDSQNPAPPTAGAGGSQGYLAKATSGGIGLEAVQGNAGADGQGVMFVDMEQDWDLAHQGLPNVQFIDPKTDGSDGNQGDDAKIHGTETLGVVLMNGNAGRQGIAPKATGRVIREYKGDDLTNRKAEAIITAAHKMNFGDVLLLESQEQRDGGDLNTQWPVEVVDINFEAIQLATAAGVVVVEPAGNFGDGPDSEGLSLALVNGANLDNYYDLNSKPIFDRTFRDSGAIIVSGSTSTLPHGPNIIYPGDQTEYVRRFNFGSRVDMFAWGENVFTTVFDSNHNDWYTSNTGKPFSGTSSASAIIAGAAIVLQGIIGREMSGPVPYRFSPAELRYLLKEGGTKSQDSNDNIGVMPNLEAIVKSPWMNLPPDLYLRSRIGDFGQRPLKEFTSASPDIIVRQTREATPMRTLGDDSNDKLSEPLKAGNTHYVYVRLWNGGGTDSAAVDVDLYWFQPAAILTPDVWNRSIGTVTVPPIPAGGHLMVSTAGEWPWPKELGTSTDVCIAAVSGTAGNVKPQLPNFKSNPPVNDADTPWARFVRFAEENKNVAFFSALPITEPIPQRQPHSFSLYVPGSGDIDRKFRLESLGRLPHGSVVHLYLPLSLARRLRVKMLCYRGGEHPVELPLPPNAMYRIGEGLIQANSIEKCTLEVQMPEDAYTSAGQFEFSIRTLYEDREVGRMTWRFGKFSPEKYCKAPADPGPA